MKKFILKHQKAFLSLTPALLLGVILMSFQDSPLVHGKYDQEQSYTDTVPDKNQSGHMKMKDFDELMNNLDTKVMSGVQDALKNIDFTKIEKDIENAMKSIDMEKIMKDIDMEKIMKDVNNSIKSVDLDKILGDVKSSMKEIDWDKHSAEINDALKEARGELEKAKIEIKDIDMKEISKEIEKAKLEIEKSKAEIKKIDMNKVMEEAKKGIAEGKEELKQIKTMFNEMEKDGLINTKEGFSIEYKGEDLYINGKKQPENVADKYRKYTKEKNFKITIDKE